MNNLKHIIVGALWASSATFLAQVVGGLEGLVLPEPWSTVLVGIIAVLAWARAKLQEMADDG